MSEPAPTAKAVLQFLLEKVVHEPGEVKIDAYEPEDSDSVYMDVSVAKDDMGRVIGRKGRMADAIRAVVDAASVKDDRTVEIDFLDE